MPTDNITRDFDPNLDIPTGLANTRISTSPDVEQDVPDPDADIDVQVDTLADDDSQLDEDSEHDELDVPGYLSVVSQTIRTGPDGNMVVDVVIDVGEVPGAVNYEVRVTK